MKPIAAFILLTVLALVAGPVVCVAGVGGHCPAEPHGHAADNHEATPHAPCLDDPTPPAKKAPTVERPAPCGPAAAADGAGAPAAAAVPVEADPAKDVDPPAFLCSLPLLS